MAQSSSILVAKLESHAAHNLTLFCVFPLCFHDVLSEQCCHDVLYNAFVYSTAKLCMLLTAYYKQVFFFPCLLTFFSFGIVPRFWQGARRTFVLCVVCAHSLRTNCSTSFRLLSCVHCSRIVSCAGLCCNEHTPEANVPRAFVSLRWVSHALVCLFL